MKRTRRWVWVVLFIAMCLLIGGLATGWNVVLVQDYQKFLELTRRFQLPSPNIAHDFKHPWLGITLGSLGFLAAIGGSAVFFVRLLREMRLNQMQSEFLASVSHSLKTPLATLELSSELLRKGDLSDEQREKLWTSHSSELKRLKSDVNALLDAARLTHDANLVSIETIQLEGWITSQMNRWKDLLGRDGRLKREGAALAIDIAVDRRVMEMILENLMENARKFANGAAHVTLVTELDGRSWSITVRDQGVGFDPADSEKIFERFYRSKHLVSRSIPGTGLGLYLAAQGAKTLGLTLSAYSEGKGASFKLSGDTPP